MKSTTTGAASGCIIWFIVFGLLSTCLLPVGMMIGGFTSVTNLAMQTLEPLICPTGQRQSRVQRSFARLMAFARRDFSMVRSIVVMISPIGSLNT